MDIKQAKQELRQTIRAYTARTEDGLWRIPREKQRPVLLMGPPGIGKTAILSQLAQEEHVGLVCYTMTHHTRQSALGLPVIVDRTAAGRQYRATEYTMSEIIASVYEQMEKTGLKTGILFLDEINCVSETLMPAILQMLQNKTFGVHALPEGWMIAAAGNPPRYNQSARSFDMATLDRVRRIDLEPSLAVWQDYAAAHGVHPAVLAYLRLHPEHFFICDAQRAVGSFVTARGWEDLSELMQVYESLGIPVDRQVVEQYLQLPQVASDFANYLQLYNKYKQVYRVDELLSGTWEPVRASELRDAPFDEKLGVLGLLLSRLADGARDAYRLDALTDALHADLLAIREGEKAIASLPDEKRAALADKRNGGSSDKDALYVASREVERLDAYRQTLMLEKVPEDQQFDRLKALFSADVDARAAAADKTDAELANAFAFLDAAIPDSQELVLFATELTANWFTSWFIQNFGCDAYFAHNKRLLFDDTQKQLLQNIESARNEES